MGTTPLQWATRALVLVCVLGLLQAAWETANERSLARACHKLQRRLQQNLDNLGSANVDTTMDDIWGRMVAAGFLNGQMGKTGSGQQQLVSVDIEDPGGGPGSHRNFVLMAGSRQVGCAVHGSPFVGKP